jgi:hypothetical protein
VRSASRARDVIESYRQFHIIISGWSTTLQEAVESFARISDERPVVGQSVALTQLAQALSAAASSRLQIDEETLDRLSKDLRSIVTEVLIPGVPRREDQDWSF